MTTENRLDALERMLTALAADVTDMRQQNRDLTAQIRDMQRNEWRRDSDTTKTLSAFAKRLDDLARRIHQRNAA